MSAWRPFEKGRSQANAHILHAIRRHCVTCVIYQTVKADGILLTRAEQNVRVWVPF